MDSPARLHAEITGFLRQHCPVCDERHLVLLGWMVTGLLLSQTVCFDQWQRIRSADSQPAGQLAATLPPLARQ